MVVVQDVIANRFYVYALLDTRKPGNFSYKIGEEEIRFDYEPFYIGKGKRDRWSVHFQPKAKKSDLNRFKQRVIEKIISETGKNPKAVKVKISLNHIESYNYEQKLINIIGRRTVKKGPLTNLSDGGPGPSGQIPHNKGKPTSLAQSLKISEANKGHKSTDEQKAKLTMALSKNTYRIVSPEGEEFTVKNLNQFSRDHGFSTGSLARVASNEYSHHKGWKVVAINKLNDKKIFSFYKLVDSNKNEYTTNSLRKFCEEFDLDGAVLNLILKGKFKQHKGWVVCRLNNCTDVSLLTNYYPRPKNLWYEYTLKDPEGKIYRIENLVEFCEKHGLDSSHMVSVCIGKRLSQKGWTGTRKESSWPDFMRNFA